MQPDEVSVLIEVAPLDLTDVISTNNLCALQLYLGTLSTCVESGKKM